MILELEELKDMCVDKVVPARDLPHVHKESLKLSWLQLMLDGHAHSNSEIASIPRHRTIRIDTGFLID